LAREVVRAGRAPDRVSGTGAKRAVGLLDIMQGDLKGPIMDELPPSSLGRLEQASKASAQVLKSWSSSRRVVQMREYLKGIKYEGAERGVLKDLISTAASGRDVYPLPTERVVDLIQWRYGGLIPRQKIVAFAHGAHHLAPKFTFNVWKPDEASLEILVGALLNGLGRTIERIELCLDRDAGEVVNALSTGVLPSLISLRLRLEAHPFNLSIAVLPSLCELSVQGAGVALPDHLFPNLTELEVDPFRGQQAKTIIAAAREGRLSRLEALRLDRTGLDVPDAMRLANQLEHMPKLQVISGVIGALSIPQWRSIRDRHPHVELQ
jgi:hypothetical protein